MLTQRRKRTPAARTTKGKRGVCRECGCSHFEPCISANGVTCGWADREHTLCTFCARKRAGGRGHEQAG